MLEDQWWTKQKSQIMNVMSREYWVYHMPQTFQIEPLSTPDLSIWGRGTCEDKWAIWLAGAEGHKAMFGRLGSSEKH